MRQKTADQYGFFRVQSVETETAAPGDPGDHRGLSGEDRTSVRPWDFYHKNYGNGYAKSAADILS